MAIASSQKSELPRDSGYYNKVLVGLNTGRTKVVLGFENKGSGKTMDVMMPVQEVDDLIVMLEYYKREVLNNGG